MHLLVVRNNIFNYFKKRFNISSTDCCRSQCKGFYCWLAHQTTKKCAANLLHIGWVWQKKV